MNPIPRQFRKLWNNPTLLWAGECTGGNEEHSLKGQLLKSFPLRQRAQDLKLIWGVNQIERRCTVQINQIYIYTYTNKTFSLPFLGCQVRHRAMHWRKWRCHACVTLRRRAFWGRFCTSKFNNVFQHVGEWEPSWARAIFHIPTRQRQWYSIGHVCLIFWGLLTKDLLWYEELMERLFLNTTQYLTHYSNNL